MCLIIFLANSDSCMFSYFGVWFSSLPTFLNKYHVIKNQSNTMKSFVISGNRSRERSHEKLYFLGIVNWLTCQTL